MEITVHFTDGTKEDFPETSRAGGSYRTSYRTEGQFVIIKNAYGNQTIIPSERIKKVETRG